MSDMQLRRPKGSRKDKKELGRGTGCGRGGTAGKGNKGQKARSGGGVRPGFEGGQMPLFRRIARRGFSNFPFRAGYAAVTLRRIQDSYQDNETVSIDTLRQKKLIRRTDCAVKIIGAEGFTRKLTFEVADISEGARRQIEQAGSKLK
jgi:large subunit ribosomal protein L15